ncbi:MAG: type VI secretion system lipoprotein TssJ [Deltaproteobacteria bacterium]|uniref:type VI secretion system lipoprotein TssJ n=1 Tax=Candidatus Deferrimicrobium sp. TaxID=3060586 RepID=UPI002726D065|nr:type VI secretion system lipoprotein TssJ [Candidatus Deferrimicrobium sp.]MCR4310541.1 type VI secretion system lipoprotein TssJ [Deltaproteobacteria bacterium]MDO8737575.1 type VI secretion system lipoprotein TssJ [Candidatus Deferrimicrobium sp.]
MRRASMLLACGIVLPLLLASCAGGSSSGGGAGGGAASGVYQYEKDAITLHLKGDVKLNLFEKRPHTLLVCVYQLRDPNALNQILQDAEDVSKLLECGRFDPSIVNAKKFILQPGKEITEALDRAEGARYIGIVAGYYNLDKQRASRILPVPVGGTFGKKASKMDLDVFLGPDEIQGVKEKK